MLIRRGPAEDVVAVRLGDRRPRVALGRVRAAGLPAVEAIAEEAAMRGVERMWGFPAPKGVSTEVFTRARAVSTDEEIVRIWQRIGLADRLNAEMLRQGHQLRRRQRPTFLSFTPQTWGNGHPTQQFICKPALEQTLRSGVDRYPNVEVLLGHECIGLDP